MSYFYLMRRNHQGGSDTPSGAVTIGGYAIQIGGYYLTIGG